MNPPTHSLKLVSWNSITLTVPSSWQAIVSDSCHLIFEHKFEAVFEIKWKEVDPHDFSSLSKSSIDQWQKLSGHPLKKCTLQTKNYELFEQFDVSAYTSMKDSPQVIFLCNHQHRMFVMLQFLAPYGKNHPLDSIYKINCLPKTNNSQLWAIQDFRFMIPGKYQYTGHTIKAGLTVIHFSYKKWVAHICRVASASIRLNQNTASEILSSLIGPDVSGVAEMISDTKVRYSSTPSVLRQILLRLQKKKPFVEATLRHDPINDRLLCVILEGTQPIDLQEFGLIEEEYEILPEKK